MIPAALQLVSRIYAEGPLQVNGATPTDVVASPPISGGDIDDVFGIFSCLYGPGAGTTSIDIVVGMHHPDLSGGGDFSTLSMPILAGETTKLIVRMFEHSPAEYPGLWPDAQYRVAIQQIGATGNGSVYGVGMALFVGSSNQ